MKFFEAVDRQAGPLDVAPKDLSMKDQIFEAQYLMLVTRLTSLQRKFKARKFFDYNRDKSIAGELQSLYQDIYSLFSRYPKAVKHLEALKSNWPVLTHLGQLRLFMDGLGEFFNHGIGREIIDSLYQDEQVRRIQKNPPMGKVSKKLFYTQRQSAMQPAPKDLREAYDLLRSLASNIRTTFALDPAFAEDKQTILKATDMIDDAAHILYAETKKSGVIKHNFNRLSAIEGDLSHDREVVWKTSGGLPTPWVKAKDLRDGDRNVANLPIQVSRSGKMVVVTVSDQTIRLRENTLFPLYNGRWERDRSDMDASVAQQYFDHTKKNPPPRLY